MASKNLVKSDKATMKSIWSIVLELLEDTNDINANDEIYKKILQNLGQLILFSIKFELALSNSVGHPMSSLQKNFFGNSTE